MSKIKSFLLDFNFTHCVRDPLWKNIYLTEELFNTTKTKEFIRLFNIKQLGPTELVYSGATHTRASHSFGVYHTSLLLLDSLIKKGANQWVSKTGIFSFLAASLFHDAGHFPFTHSLKELSLKEHEDLTAEILLNEPMKSIIAKTGADPFMAAAIVSHKIQTQDSETIFFRKLLSGVLDPDKIDYLNRDAFFCGVPYGIQDTDFIISVLNPHKTKGISLNAKNILAVEHLLFSKYLMYKAVYWHKDVRIATAMIKKTLFAAIQNKIISSEELYSLDDFSLYELLAKKDFAEKECANLLQKRTLYTIVKETDFDQNCSFCKKLLDLSFRTQIEDQIAQNAQLKTFQVLIDIPENISFESDLWIEDENKIFSESSTVFTKETVLSFTQNLRKIRLAISPFAPEKNKEKAQNYFSSLLNK